MRRIGWGAAAAVAAVGALAFAPRVASAQSPAPEKLDVLFIGAHPDDEAGQLSTMGQWIQDEHLSAGVITVTRGEGGGNAVGPEEGPALGLLREAEERSAVGLAGVDRIFNLDKVDFFYTVSAPLTREAWNAPESLARVVRVVRETRPDVILTMDPSPSPGNHGNHQEAARLAVEAYRAAADPKRFRSQITREGLDAWRVSRVLRSGATGSPAAALGRGCTKPYKPADASATVWGVWSGARAGNGRTWAAIERSAQQRYASQGWTVFPDVTSPPSKLGCDFYTLIDSRTPAPLGSRAADAVLQGAVLRGSGGLALGTEAYMTLAGGGAVAPGGSLRVTLHVRSPRSGGSLTVTPSLPKGWRGGGTLRFTGLTADREATRTFTVRPPSAASEGRVRLTGRVRDAGGGSGEIVAQVQVVGAVTAAVQPLAQVADFDRWSASAAARVPWLAGMVDHRLAISQGGSRTVRIDLRNTTRASQSGTVALALPDGFTADAAAKPYAGLAAGARGSVSFTVKNTDAALKTSVEGGEEGDYGFTVTTTAGDAKSTSSGALNLVPATTVPAVGAGAAVDGAAAPGEYTGAPLDLSRVWEGDEPDSKADASGSALLAWGTDGLHVFVDVVDDKLGTVLPTSDAKRHWRTDSVEIAVDPKGDSENTATTFKVGIFPTTGEGTPAATRDADNRQGPIAQTAKGMTVASKVSSPYTGYTVETMIPWSALPEAVDPAKVGLDLFIYDSDTKDKTGQSRLGWSTWGGVQGDPYRWGVATLAGFAGAVGQPGSAQEPVIPSEALQSLASPQTILQSSGDRVPVAGGRGLASGLTISSVTWRGSTASVRIASARAGTAHLFLTRSDGRGLGSRTVTLKAGVARTVAIRASSRSASAHVVGALARSGATRATARSLR